MAVNKASYLKLSAVDKETFVAASIPLLETIAVYITEDAAPALLSKKESKKRKLAEDEKRKEADLRAVKGKSGEVAPRVRGTPVTTPTVVKEETVEITAQDKKELAAFIRLFSSSTSSSLQVFVCWISLSPWPKLNRSEGRAPAQLLWRGGLPMHGVKAGADRVDDCQCHNPKCQHDLFSHI